VAHCARANGRYAARMKLAMILFAVACLTGLARAAEWLPIEKQVAEIAKAKQPTVVHFWAPWCPNCRAEAREGWGKFINDHPDVNVVFVTVWSDNEGDGAEVLKKLGVGGQKNFQLLLHPNTSIRTSVKTSEFMGLPMIWIPATWIFREGKLRYALNYGEVRFPMLQQLVADTKTSWDR
jgi:thiol-disulfide isomerase/thioredoxin